ncbi:hypothetical protein FBU59_006925 [Linderina macrospora]|uniref:Uncharacterized protein n=1 Tax=Linderina macrospora TaxID=4868 RepID=A0ACC1IYJ4_9FUNG|nr:hypothetical protein FBU59_006925 [Linderina macrospora]
MLRGQSSGGASGLGGTLAHSGPRIGGNRGTLGGIPSVDVDDRDVFDLDDDIQSPGLQQPSAIPGFGRRNMSRQSDDYSEDLDADDDSSIIAAEERGFGNFGSPGLNMPQRTDTSGITASAHIGSLPVQIPLFSGSMVGSSSLSRREINKRVGEREMNKRREENIKKIPKTFVPPHELIQQLYDRESDMLSGSKPRDSYGWSRRQAPG